MKRWLLKGVLMAAVALPAVSGAAWAQNPPAIALPSLSSFTPASDFGCSNATLQGEYAFGVTNYTVPEVVAGVKFFDGKGSLTQRDYAGDSLRTIGRKRCFRTLCLRPAG